MFLKFLLGASLLLGSAQASAQAITYDIDANHTDVIAQWSHFGFSNPTAHFGEAFGTIVFDEKQPQNTQVNVALPLSGMEAYSKKFNEHLQSADFFDVEKHPLATFKSTKVQKTGKNTFKMWGDLSIKEHTKEVVLDVVLNKIGERNDKPAIGFDAQTTLKRSDFGLGMAAPMVSDEVSIRITTEAHGLVAVKTNP